MARVDVVFDYAVNMFTMDNHFDSEKFIIEIENRPAIWNSACSEYSNRDVKRKCWEELTDIFSNEDNTVQEKKEIGELKK